MISGLPCNACDRGTCGNCVAERLVVTGFIQKASDHCSCAAKGHPNKVTKDRPNKAVFSQKRDDDYTPPAEIKMVDESE